MSLTREVGLEAFEISCQIGSPFITKFIETFTLKLLKIAPKVLELNIRKKLANEIKLPPAIIFTEPSLIDMANLINKKPLEIFELSVLYNEIPEEYKKSLIYPYLLVDNNMAKITARIKDSENINRKILINEIKSFLENNSDSSVKNFKVNGLLVLYNNMLESLFKSQIKWCFEK